MIRARHRRTLRRIFIRPTPSDIRWTEIEAMLRAAGVEVSERAGSRVGLRKGDKRITIHRPHPSPQTDRNTVRDIANFLKDIGVSP